MVTDTGGDDHVEVIYKAVSLTTTEQDPKGGTGASETVAWDVAAGKTSTTPLGIAKADTSDGSGGSRSLDYYLTVDGLDGGVTVKGHEGAFAVENFVFDILADSSWTRGGGASVGKPEPSPLILDLKPGVDLTDFIQKITTGAQFPLLRLEGVTTGEVNKTV